MNKISILLTLFLLSLLCFHIISCFTNETFSIRKVGENKSQECTYMYDQDALKERIPDYPIHPMILARRSLREMTGEEISDPELFNILEALRWGPSNYNNQPWRVVYAKRNSPRFEEFVKILKPGNAKWAKDSSVLMILFVDMYNRYKGEKKYLKTNMFASGAAFMNMALETSARGYVVHSMAGFDEDLASKAVGIDKNNEFIVQVMIAIGKRYPLGDPKRGNKIKELNLTELMTDRRPLKDSVSQDFSNPLWFKN